ncbi:NifB/NifX family molybdenum-iron cluster-binding protein [Thermodesulfobacteriota bacterium]
MTDITVAVPSEYPGGLESLRSGHFGHCDLFTMVKVEEGQINGIALVPNVPHSQGGCQAPVQLLHDQGADALIVGGMGMRPLMGFRQLGIDVYFSQEGATVGAAIQQYISGRLEPITDRQVCGGGDGSCRSHEEES